MKGVVDYIEKAMENAADRVVIADDGNAVTGKELLSYAQSVGTGITEHLQEIRKPVVLFLEKSSGCVIAMLGVAYSGNYYTVMDVEQPIDRIKKIFETIKPECIITTENLFERVSSVTDEYPILKIENLKKCKADKDALDKIQESVTDADVLYVLFTSGSTGIPKGVVVSHRAVIAYEKWAISALKINENTIWGSQTPFYFSMSLTDLYSTLFTGAQLRIIPKSYFSFPTMLMDYIVENNINTIYWVPSAYGILMKWNAFSYKKPNLLKKALFAGEVMPMKYLNYWREMLPDTEFYNLFGPTETTDICTWYHVNRKFADDEPLPIGNACDNCDSYVISDDNKLVKQTDTETVGELYVRSSFLAYGYLNNEEKTKEVFVQNPINAGYPEIVYKTGDLVRYNEYGELMYVGRRDLQIKHMGYRIETGEIENTIGAIDKVDVAICVYNAEADQIIVFYQGKLKKEQFAEKVVERLPVYMQPQKIEKVSNVLYNANGKIDRVRYKQLAKELLQKKEL